jgi:hypothetical protein
LSASLHSATLAHVSKLWALVAVTACGASDPQQAPQVIVRDSAGIEVVTSHSAQWTDRSRWMLDTVPAASVGGDEGDPHQQFKTVTLATRLSNGRIGVVVGGELRWFDAAGKYVMTSLPAGDGPGEFRSIRHLHRRPGDTTVAEGVSGAIKIVTFAPDGSFVRERLLDPAKFTAATGSACCRGEMLPDGSFVTVTEDSTIPYSDTHRKPTEAGSRMRVTAPRHTRHLSRWMIVPPSLDSAYPAGINGNIEYVDVPGAELVTMIVHPFFSRRSYLAAGGTPLRIIMGTNPQYEIEVWTPQGRLERIARRSNGRRAPTEAEEKEAVAGIARQIEQQDSPLALDRAIASVLVPDSLPAVAGLFVGPEGEFLVQRNGFLPSHNAPLFDVFSASGRWLGSLRLPPRAKLLEVGTDYLLAVRLYEFDVPRVEAYRLRK